MGCINLLLYYRFRPNFKKEEEERKKERLTLAHLQQYQSDTISKYVNKINGNI